MADDDLKIFISWSGDLAKSIALVWHDLLLEMFDRTTPWVSDLDIEAGARPLDDIKRELDGTSFGIIVVTPENQNAPWLNFEAGALSKALSDATTRVMPSLVNFTSPSQVTSPLKQFQGNLLNQEGVMKILKTIARGVNAEWTTKERAFNRAWTPEYEQRFNDCLVNAVNPAKPSTRPPEEMLDELLTITRDISRRIDSKNSPTTDWLGGYSDAKRLEEDMSRYINQSLPNISLRTVNVGVQRGNPAIVVIIENPRDDAEELRKHLIERYSRRATNNIKVASYPSGMNGGEGYMLHSDYLLD